MGFGSSRGNVLFLILLAVALFAALSYAVTQSNRSGGNNISDEDARLYASQITQYATSLEQVVTRLRLINSCNETQISFARDSDGDDVWFDADDDYHNANSPSDLSCHVFHVDGGGLTYLVPEGSNDGSDWVFTSRNRILNVGTSVCAGGSGATDCSELLAILPNVALQTCITINDMLDIDNPSGVPDQDDNIASTTPFQGEYLYNATAGGAAHTGKHSGCYEGDNNPASGTYHYYHVLIPR